MNMRHAIKAALLMCLVVAFTAAAQTVYRWVDKDGKVHYGDSPPAENKSVQQKNLKAGQGVNADNVPFAVKDATQRNPVTAFLTNCGQPCDGARSLLAKRGVPYTAKDPENNPNDADALKALAGGLDVPFLQVGDRSIRGFTEESWNSALDAGGYPRVNPFSKAPEPKKSEMPKDRKFEEPGKAPAAPAKATPSDAKPSPPAK
jgi:glutaredoxin